MQGRRQIFGEQKSVSIPCVLQSCAHGRSCFCTVDHEISLCWAHSYRSRPCCCNTDEVGAVSSAAAWNREITWTFALSWQVYCTDNLSWHHGPWGGETKTHRRQNPGILFLKLVKKEDTNKLFKWTLVFPVNILMTSDTACDSAWNSSSTVLEFQLHFKWCLGSTLSLVTILFLLVIYNVLLKVTTGVAVWVQCIGDAQQGSSNAKPLLIPAVLFPHHTVEGVTKVGKWIKILQISALKVFQNTKILGSCCAAALYFGTKKQLGFF